MAVCVRTSDGATRTLPPDVASACRVFDEMSDVIVASDEDASVAVPFPSDVLTAFVRCHRLYVACSAVLSQKRMERDYPSIYRRVFGSYMYSRINRVAEFLNVAWPRFCGVVTVVQESFYRAFCFRGVAGMTKKQYATCTRLAVILCDVGFIARPVSATFHEDHRLLAAHVPQGAPPERVMSIRVSLLACIKEAISHSCCESCRDAYDTYFSDAAAPLPTCQCLVDETGLLW